MATLTDVLNWFYKPFLEARERDRELNSMQLGPQKINWNGPEYIAGVDLAAPGNESEVCVTCWRKNGDRIIRVEDDNGNSEG